MKMYDLSQYFHNRKSNLNQNICMFKEALCRPELRNTEGTGRNGRSFEINMLLAATSLGGIVRKSGYKLSCVW